MGRCYLEAGFTLLDVRTKTDDLLVFQMLPSSMPDPSPLGGQLQLLVA